MYQFLTICATEQLFTLGIILDQLGLLVDAQGKDAEARRLHNESLGISRPLEDKVGLAQSLYQLGLPGQKEGGYTEARRLYQESLEIRQLVGDKIGAARNVYQLGLLAEAEGDLENAFELVREAEKALFIWQPGRENCGTKPSAY